MELSASDYLLIETLARETGKSLSDIEEIYRREVEQLESIAKIRTYVPVIAWRHARLKLKSLRC